MLIKEITIQNFRSIVNVSFDPNDLNIIVGNNDVGKSNFLKALNLFFNNQTKPGNNFNFKTDYSFSAPTRAKKAAEISIKLVVQPPKSFSENREVIWHKTWRQQSQLPYSETQRHSDGNELRGRSKVSDWLKNIRFRYVPAIKSNVYFTSLLRDLHDVLAVTVETDLRKGASEFMSLVKFYTEDITTNLYNKIGIKSFIELPSDLSGLFEILDFQTGNGQNFVSLTRRGDGIKIRHIPIILKYLHEQENMNRQQGSLKLNTIWGYEEPENNLELSKAFEQANEFLEYSKNIQIFLTTHSPAFYSIGNPKNNHVNIYFVKSENGISKIDFIETEESYDFPNLDDKMGLLPFITPYIETEVKEYKERLKELNLKIEKLSEDEPTLFVEGLTDVTILKAAIKIFEPELVGYLKVRSDSGAGCNWVKDFLMAWVCSRKKFLAGGLFDKDEDGKKAKREADEFLKSRKSNNVKTFFIKTPKHLHGIFSKDLSLPITLEEVFSPRIWEYAEHKNWLVERDDILKINNFNQSDKTFKQHCLEKEVNEQELRYVLRKVKDYKKADLSEYISNLKGDDLKDALLGFQPLIEEIAKHFKSPNKV
jgi:AAA15 family ATPase/GTPase